MDDELSIPRVMRILEVEKICYFTRHSSFLDLCQAIRGIFCGEPTHDALVREKLVHDLVTDKPSLRIDGPSLAKLTSRELQVMQLLAKGRLVREVAEELKLAHSTVDNHKTRLMRKLGITRLPQLVRIAVEQGLVDRDSEV